MFQKPRRPVTKVYIHCSASDNPDHDDVSVIKDWHLGRGWSDTGYHYFITKTGELQTGRSLELRPAAQGGHNRGSIAICVSGLKDFTEASFARLRKLCQEIQDAYNDQVTHWGHCDVSSKPCPVFDYKAVLGLNKARRLTGAGFKLENVVPAGDVEGGFRAAPEPARAPVLSLGSKGFLVKELQRQLAALGYHPGSIDGHFGKRTRSAVLAFQADNDLITDGIAGEMTFEALEEQTPREVSETRQKASLVDLAKAGSRIADADVKNKAAGAVTLGGGALGLLGQFSGLFTSFKTQLDPIAEPFGGWSNVMVGALLVAVAFMLLQSHKAGQARLDDHRTGKTS